MHYYIDGYNLLFRIHLTEGSLQEKRELTISQLYEKITLLHLNVTLVFDGYYRQGLGSRSHFHSLEICFTDEGETADEWILNELLSSSNPREEVVVTSDKQLAWRTRRLQAKTENVERFFHWLDQTARKKKKEKKQEEKKKNRKEQKNEEIAITPETSVSSLETIDPTIHAYLHIFEENFQKLIEKSPPPKKKESEIDRWLRIFEERFQEKKEEN